MTRIAIIDSQISGISGDMLLCSLIDAGANKDKVIKAILACQSFLKGTKIIHADFVKTTSHGFSATEFEFEYNDGVHQRQGVEMYRSLASCCDSLDLEQRTKAFALESMKTIVAAEALIHDQEISKVHLHETSSIDTFADIIGCAIALQDLKLFESQIFSTNVAVGGGVIKFSHGVLPNPSNAILQIFKGKPFTLIGGYVKEELTTPTGAAMLVNLTSRSINYYPSFAPEKMGYGAGHKKLKGFTNILRLVIGNSSLLIETNKDIAYLIETNVDDISGEIIGHLIELLTEAGARDVTVISGISKKNRPTYIIRVITDQTKMYSVLELLFKESSSLGIRVQAIERFILPRSIVTIPVNIHENRFNIHVKVAKDTSGNTISIKPEFEDIRLISSRLGISVKRTIELATAQVVQMLG
jgi:uncharacterized protein (TIGR00299 family) protein